MKGPEDIQEETTEEPQVPDENRERITAPIEQKDIDRLMVARILKLDGIDDLRKNERRIDNIIGWAHEIGANSEDDLVAEISRLRNKLGNPSIYELNTYIYLKREHLALMRKGIDLKNKLKKFHS